MLGAARFLPALIILCPLIVFGLYYRVYPDESTFKLLQGRYFLDGFQSISLYPQCVGTWRSTPPLTWLPALLWDSVFFRIIGADEDIRLLGLVFFFILLFVLYKLFSRHFQSTACVVWTITLGALSLGTLPVLLIMNRPEQVILIGVLLVTFISIRPPRKDSVLVDLLRVILIYCIACELVVSHPKALFYSPVMLLGAFWASNRWSLKILGSLSILLLIGTTVKFSNERFRCPESAFHQQILLDQSLPLGLLKTDPVLFRKAGTYNLKHSHKYVSAVQYAAEYQSDWLPPRSTPLSPVLTSANRVIFGFYVGALGLLLVLALVHFVRGALQLCYTRTEMIAFAMMGALLGQGFFQATKNFYESAIVLPIVLFAIALLFPRRLIERHRRVATLVAGILLVLGAVNMKFIFSEFWSYFTAGRIQIVTPAERAKRNAEIEDSLQLCKLDQGGPIQHLMIDDYSYPYLATRAFQPIHLDYVSRWWGQGITDLPAFLERSGSVGGVIQCEHVPPQLRSCARGTGTWCCFALPCVSNG